MTSQKLGLVIITAALVAIATIGAILTADGKARQANTIRADGTALVRLLAGFAYDDLAPRDGTLSVIETLRTHIARTPLVYAAVFDANGNLAAHTGSAPTAGAAIASDGGFTTALLERPSLGADGEPRSSSSHRS